MVVHTLMGGITVCFVFLFLLHSCASPCQSKQMTDPCNFLASSQYTAGTFSKHPFGYREPISQRREEK